MSGGHLTQSVLKGSNDRRRKNLKTNNINVINHTYAQLGYKSKRVYPF